MKEHPIFQNSEDFEWYKLELDVADHTHYEHHGEPEHYPCMLLKSEYDSNPNGPDGYDHTFIYQTEGVCDKCGHKTLVWPKL